MSEFAKMNVGDNLWVIERQYGRGPAKPPVEYTVVKMGRDYFYASALGGWPRDVKFSKEDGREWVAPNDNGSYRSQAYRHREEWENERYETTVRSAIADYFRKFNAERSLTLPQAEQIAAILNIGPNAQTDPVPQTRDSDGSEAEGRPKDRSEA